MAIEKNDKLISGMVFENYQDALLEKEKTQRKLDKIYIGFFIAVLAQVAWIFGDFMPGEVTTFREILRYVAVVLSFTAYFFGGGFKIIAKAIWEMGKGVALFGFLCTPFPINIWLGLTGILFGIVFTPLVFFFLPLVVVFLGLVKLKRIMRDANEYLLRYESIEKDSSVVVDAMG